MKFYELPLLLKFGDVARYTGLKRKKIDVLVEIGVLKVVATGGGHRLFTRESVKKFLNIEGNEEIPT